MKIVNLHGQRFGKLLVIGLSLKSSKNGKWWSCVCDCGNTKDIRSSSLRFDMTKSCGCLNPQRLLPYEALYRRMVRDNTIHLRILDLSLTYEDFVEFTKFDKCYYCTSPLIWKEFSSGPFGYNLDRKDNDKGYHKGNLVPCCARCNMGKRDTFSFEEWYGMTAYFRK